MLKSSLKTKLDTLSERYDEITALLSEPDIINNTDKFRELSREYSELETVVHAYKAYQSIEASLENTAILSQDSDAEIRELAEEEAKSLQQEQLKAEQNIQILLIPKNPDDKRNIYLEIRAGTGGLEAAIFAGDLFRMYGRYAEKKRLGIRNS